MRDESEKARHRELEQRDAELAQFSHLRSKLDQANALEMYDAGPAPKRIKQARYAVALNCASMYLSSISRSCCSSQQAHEPH